MWFSRLDALKQRIVNTGILYLTDDAWSTSSNSGAVTPTPTMIDNSAVANEDANILVGLTLGTHVIGCLTSPDDTTATGIAGANAGSAPYTDSIPNTCGGVCIAGIGSIPNSGTLNIYGVVME